MAAVVLAVAIGIITAWVLTTEPSAAAEDLGPLDQPVSAELMARLQEISTQGLKEGPNLHKPAMKRIRAGGESSSGAPLVLYVGADFCPYCAALRWPLTLALMRFGDLSGLRYTRSNSRDVYPDTATFTFSGATLRSDVIDFHETELEDRDRKALQTLDSQAHAMFEAFDKKPYTQYPGSIPFLYLGGQYLEIGSPFSPDALQGLDWDQVANRLESGNNAAWRDIMGEANLLTAAICTLTQGKPDDVCAASAIQSAAGHLPQ